MPDEADTVLYAADGEVAVVTIANPPVNALSLSVRSGLISALQRALADTAVRAVVVQGQGKLFCAGADIAEFGQKRLSPTLRDVCEAFENASKPVVAAMRGVAFGGGLELALSCHYRVGGPGTRCALPEVNLGLLPGAGGTQRLPRLVGAPKALQMITSGEPVLGAEAYAIGLIDELAAEDLAIPAAAVALAQAVVTESRPLLKVRDRDDRLAEARAESDLFDTFRAANARRFRGAMAPEYCIRAVQSAVEASFDEGMAREAAMFIELVEGEQSAAQRYAFFAEREVWKIPDVPADTPVLPIRKVGVIGAGTMGGGIAMNFLNAGIAVAIVETSQTALDRGLGVVRKNYERSARSGRISMDDVDKRMNLLTGGADWQALADCDLIVEAVYESLEVKTEVFARLTRIARPDAILASNTSYLPLEDIAAVVDHPERFLGMHFFSPANVMKLLEGVRCQATSRPVIATVMQLAKRIGKIAALVGVGHGFVGNRMLAARTQQANALLVEGALPWDVDPLLTAFGLPMGPFQIADLAGLDLGWTAATSTASTIRERLNELERRGQKTGAGFYDYDADRNATPSKIVEAVIVGFSKDQGVTRREISSDEILERLLFPMINEGAKILDEGVAIRASDIDVVWLNGYGWPRYRGGPMWWGQALGLDVVLRGLNKYVAQGRPEFQPSPLLERLVAERRGFGDL